MARIVSWNVNGIRSLPRPLSEIFRDLPGDIYCFQETKISRSSLSSDIAFVQGFNSYFSFCRKRDGYSGVATYCKDDFGPMDAYDGLGDRSILEKSIFSPTELKLLDSEGRALITRHEFIYRHPEKSIEENRFLNIINVYCPRLDPERDDRRKYKSDFYRLLQSRAEEILKIRGEHVLIIGDLNCSHRKIDHCDPDDEFDTNEYRLWMTEFLREKSEILEKVDIFPSGKMSSFSGKKFIDCFRWIYEGKKEAYTCWNTKIGARATNFGVRIDYALVDYEFFDMGLVEDVTHATDFYGSDHCPVVVTLKNCRFSDTAIRNLKLPDLCTKFMPELKGVQQALTKFLTKREAISDNEIIRECVAVKKTKIDSKSIENYFFRSEKSEKTQEKSEEVVEEIREKSTSESVSKWKEIFQKPAKAIPLCKGHQKPCIENRVKKSGPNFNRRFYVCALPMGKKDDPNARCDHFQWCSS